MRAVRLPARRGTRIRLEPKLHLEGLGDEGQVSNWFQSRAKPLAIDLFSGAGGLSLGLANAGFSVVAAADRDATSLETHAHNIGGLTWCGDLEDPTEFLSQLSDWGIDRVDLVAGGPPCQPFSQAGVSKIAHLVREGVRREKDKRSSLWKSFLQVIDHLQPLAVLVENVPGFERSQNGAALEALRSEFKRRGYESYVDTLKSWQYGVPQHRARLFVVGLKDARPFNWPTSTDVRPTLRDAIGDLPVVGGGQRQEELHYPADPSTDFGRLMRRDLDQDERCIIRDHITRFVREDDAAIYASMGQGQNYRDIDVHLRRYRDDIFTDKYHRLSWDEISRTITAHIAKDGYWYIHPSEDRTLSIREAARIQTFPDSFRFAGYPTGRYRQIGNAVPPMLAEAVGSSIFASLETSAPRIREFAPEYQISPARTRLAQWHVGRERGYEWRSETDPWMTLLAELCLHRTRADQVADVFSRLRNVGSSPASLLKNRKQAEKLLWHLGLHWRADLFFTLAETLVSHHDGIVPDSYDELMSLPGVGDYIASAVLCFGFGQPMSLVDTNTSRIIGRFTGRGNEAKWKLRRSLYELSQPEGPDSGWNYALLDLGAKVCKPKNPDCDVCPFNSECKIGCSDIGYNVS